MTVAAVHRRRGGLFLLGMNTAWTPLTTPVGRVYPPLPALLNGVWILPGVLAGLVVRKPGAALFAETVAAAIEALTGGLWGFTSLYYGVVEGLGVEIVFALMLYRRFGLGRRARRGRRRRAGALRCSTSPSTSRTTRPGQKLAYVVLSVLSCAVIAGPAAGRSTRGARRTGRARAAGVRPDGRAGVTARAPRHRSPVSRRAAGGGGTRPGGRGRCAASTSTSRPVSGCCSSARAARASRRCSRASPVCSSRRRARRHRGRPRGAARSTASPPARRGGTPSRGPRPHRPAAAGPGRPDRPRPLRGRRRVRAGEPRRAPGGDLAAGRGGAARGRRSRTACGHPTAACPAASGSGSRSPACSRCARACCCWTSLGACSTTPGTACCAQQVRRGARGHGRHLRAGRAPARGLARPRRPGGRPRARRGRRGARARRRRRCSPITAPRSPLRGVWVPGPHRSRAGAARRPGGHPAARRARPAARGAGPVGHPARRGRAPGCRRSSTDVDLAVRAGTARRARGQRLRQVDAGADAGRSGTARGGRGRRRAPALARRPAAPPASRGGRGSSSPASAPCSRSRSTSSWPRPSPTSWRWGRGGPASGAGEVDAPRRRSCSAGSRLEHLARANPYTLSGGEQRRLSVAARARGAAAGPRARRAHVRAGRRGPGPSSSRCSARLVGRAATAVVAVHARRPARRRPGRTACFGSGARTPARGRRGMTADLARRRRRTSTPAPSPPAPTPSPSSASALSSPSRWCSASTWSPPARRSRSRSRRCRGAGVGPRGAVAARPASSCSLRAAAAGSAPRCSAPSRGRVAGVAVAVRILAVAAARRRAARHHRPDRPRRRPGAGAAPAAPVRARRRSPPPACSACWREEWEVLGLARRARGLGDDGPLGRLRDLLGRVLRPAGARGPARDDAGDGDGGARLRRHAAPDLGAAEPADAPRTPSSSVTACSSRSERRRCRRWPRGTWHLVLPERGAGLGGAGVGGARPSAERAGAELVPAGPPPGTPLSIDATSRAVPSGCAQAPRPGTSAVRSGRPAGGCAARRRPRGLPTASASAGRPLTQGPHRPAAGRPGSR